MPTMPQQLVNQNRYDYTSIEVLIEGVPYRGVKSVDYSDSLDPQKVYGTSARPLGRTRGKFDADASLEVFKEDASNIRAALAALGLGGYGEGVFTVVVTYGELPASFTTDVLFGCRIKKTADSHAQGADSLTEKWDLDVLDLLRNGVSILSAPAYAK